MPIGVEGILLFVVLVGMFILNRNLGGLMVKDNVNPFLRLRHRDGELSVLDSGGIVFMDRNETIRAGLTLLEKRSSLMLHDANGTPRAFLSVTASEAYLNLMDKSGKIIGLIP